MAEHPSSQKRHRQSLKRKARNTSQRSKLHTIKKKLLALAKKEEALKFFPGVVSAYHKAAQKSVIHQKNADRHIARLAKHVSGLSA